MLFLQYGSTPLLRASFGGHTEVIQILLLNGAAIEAKDKVSTIQFITDTCYSSVMKRF